MPLFKVESSYSSYHDGRQFGPYEPGEVVELEQADAEWVNRDAPGTLKPATKTQAAKGGRAGIVPTLTPAEVGRRASRPGRRGLVPAPRPGQGGE
jgi:hypothetical protein